MNDLQLRSAILASAQYASRQAGKTVGDRSTCFLASLTSNVVLDADLSSALFGLMGVADKINAPDYSNEMAPHVASAPNHATTYPVPELDVNTKLPMLSVVCMLAVSFVALAALLFGDGK